MFSMSQWAAMGVFAIVLLLAAALAAALPGGGPLADLLGGWRRRLLPPEERGSAWQRYAQLACRLAGLYLVRRGLPNEDDGSLGAFRLGSGLVLVAPALLAASLLAGLISRGLGLLLLAAAPLCWEVVGRLSVWRRARRRRELLSELPAFLERVTVALAGGVSLEEAIRLGARGANGALRQGLAGAIRLLEAGYGLARALPVVARETDPRLVTPLVERLTRAESLGQPLTVTLRTLAGEWRRRRHEEVEERLNRLPIQLAMVGIIFIFPAVIVIVLVPNLLLFWSEGW